MTFATSNVGFIAAWVMILVGFGAIGSLVTFLFQDTADIRRDTRRQRYLAERTRRIHDIGATAFDLMSQEADSVYFEDYDEDDEDQ